MAVGDCLDHVPLGVGVEGLLDVRRVEQLEAALQVVADLLGQRQDVAVAGAVERIAQVGAETLDGGDAAERPVADFASSRG